MYRPLGEAPLSIFGGLSNVSASEARRCSGLPPFPGLPGKRWPMLPPGGNSEVGEAQLSCSEVGRLSWSRALVPLCPGVRVALALRTLGSLMVV